MITGIYIENFKGIGEPGIKLELAPLTLMFGKNSAGKSTIFHALLYAYEVLVNRNLNADSTTLGGHCVDLGGFHSFVHDHKPTNQITIRVDLDLSSVKLDETWRIPEFLVGTGENEVDLSTLGTDVWSGSVGFTIAWDFVRQAPFVSSYSVEIDKSPLISIWCDEIDKRANARVNYRHPIFRWPNSAGPTDQESAGVLDSLYPPFQSISDHFFWRDAVEVDPDSILDDPDLVLGQIPTENLDDYRVLEDVDGESFVQYFYRYDLEQQKAILEGACFNFNLPDEFDENGGLVRHVPEEFADRAKQEWEQKVTLERDHMFRPIEIIEQRDALLSFDRPLQLLIDPAVPNDKREAIGDIISRLGLAPTKLLVNELGKFRHIGPLRDIPPRSFRNTLSPDAARWSSGLAAWDLLSTASDDFGQ